MRLVHNYLGDLDPVTVAKIIAQRLKPLEECVRTMLDEDKNTN